MEGAVNKRKLWSLKKTFAHNVAAMHREEVFGIKNCEGISWECLYKDFLIIESLECNTGDVFSQMDIDCLMNKVTKECNC